MIFNWNLSAALKIFADKINCSIISIPASLEELKKITIK